MSNSFQYIPPQSALEVLYTDRDVIVVNKPSGLLSVPGRGADRQDSMLMRIRKGYPLAQVVHRLDMDTSGVMVFALRRKAERNLREQFQHRTIKKRYEAIVQGILVQKIGEIDLPIGPHPTQSLRHCISEDGRLAQTLYRVLKEGVNCTHLECTPITGRSHQIRVHLLSLGHPILGDRFYAPVSVCERSQRLMLHSSFLSFNQPYSNELLQFTSSSGFETGLSSL